MDEENQKEFNEVDGSAKLTEIVQLHLSNLSRTIDNEHRILTLVEKLGERVNTSAEEATRRDEKIQHNIEFIIQQQAQFAADMQHLRETQTRSEQRWERTVESVRSLHAIAQIHEREINSLVELQASYAESQTKLAEAQGRTDRQMSETDRRMSETDRRMAETDDRINVLVNAVERLISERRNGGQGS
ncbi:MAG: hypothetical protein H0X14_06730 [Acidobacteria bacterium]|nr:hypothetical protein [Acidobacteriota bacterium]